MQTNEMVITKAGVYELYYNINVFGTSRTYKATILKNNTEVETTTTSVTATESASGSFISNLSAKTFVSLYVGDTIGLALSTNNPRTVTVGIYANCALSVKKL